MNKSFKIMMSGGSGLFGSNLKKIEPEIISPSHAELDVADSISLGSFLDKHKPDIFVHAAAYTSPPRCAADPMRALKSNIAGTCNAVEECQKRNIRLVYISTDYVFKGDRGNYSEEDELLPQNLYAWTKLGGECAVRTYNNSLIIRTSFCPDIFPYEKAFADQYTSRDSVAKIVPIILELIKRPEVIGIIHVGTERKSVKELAVKLGRADVGELLRKDAKFNVPFDTSLNLEKLKKIL